MPRDPIQELSYRIPFKTLNQLCGRIQEFNKLCQDNNYWQLRAHQLFGLTKQLTTDV